MSRGWIVSPSFDGLWFIGPPALSAVAVATLSGLQGPALGLWGWALTIVAVDVAHVWSTLYRTYLDPEEFRRRRALLVNVPLACLAAGALLHRAGPEWFWRALAYLAVFHFVRQQFGFVMLYRRAAGEREGLFLDKAAVYASMLYPLAVWHATLPRAFDWFMPGDFVGLPPWLAPVARWAYAGVLAAWSAKELRAWARGTPANLGKLGIVLGTAAAWYVGIVRYDSDVAFTVTNVLAHGIPYFALVWAHGRRRFAAASGWLASAHRPGLGLLLFLLPLLALAFSEEALWDWFIWNEHRSLFGGAGYALALPEPLLHLLVPLLALPQATHYVLDAWIWRFDGSNPVLEELVPKRIAAPPASARPSARAAQPA